MDIYYEGWAEKIKVQTKLGHIDLARIGCGPLGLRPGQPTWPILASFYFNFLMTA